MDSMSIDIDTPSNGPSRNHHNDDDDTISSSDGSFMPPVLSNYAKELLSDQPQNQDPKDESSIVVTATSAANNRLRQQMGIPMKTTTTNNNTTTTTASYTYKPMMNNGNNNSSPLSQDDNQHTAANNDTYIPEKMNWTRFSPKTNNSSPHIQSPKDDYQDAQQHNPHQMEFSTPGVTKPSSNKELTAMKSSSRVKRFVHKGIGLGPPKRTVRHSNEGINTSSKIDENCDSDHGKSSRIRFANDDQEIPPKDYSGSSSSSSSQSSAGSSFSASANPNTKPTDYPASPQNEKREALSYLSPNMAPRSSRFQGAKTPPPKMENLVPSSKPKQSSRRQKNIIYVNDHPYQKLEMIGRGGSSKVYKVQSTTNKVRAVKKVTFDDVDSSVIQGFKGEIDLLKRLRDEERVVKLIDFEMLDSIVYVVMECGEIDLAHVLTARLNQPLDVSFVRYYSVEMLKCVAAVHKHGIVHSDLKPANFLLVKGMLKIIDFGIANVVPEYTANIHRDNQIGTPNYMAPEALLDANAANPNGGSSDPKFKVGRPSDVWSIGCIIYQMIYGKPPYGNYSGPQRMLAIMNPKVQIQYPKQGLGQVKVPREAIECMKACLERDPSTRATIDQTLCGAFLNPQAVDRDFIKNLIDHAVQYGIQRNDPVKGQELDLLTDDVWRKIQALNM